MKKVITEDVALERAELLCARSEQCSYDISVKLSRWGLSADAAGRVLTSLQSSGFVNDERFARAYVREKYLFSRWGRRKISAALYAKRIDKNIIADALEEVDMRRYASNAFKVMATKLRMLPADMELPDKRNRLIRFGISRGFETSLVMKIVESDRLWES